tara:strand:- start:599 stop:1054 length:456 start_codon:yes stop_codon:yes gene_type:complete
MKFIKWLKLEFMKTPGYMRVNISLLTILMISSVSSTALQIIKTVGNISDANISGSLELLKEKKRKVKSESDWKKYYGSCPELKEEIKQLGRENFSRTILSLHHTKGKTNYEETRQLFANRVLTEQLDDGTPKYYNSNILSRYFRKDYYGIE